ncbi:SBBP repeat-containing protein [Meiothermus taiwanensis]|uniref:SBBP repeat-containing protein n=1 Tax=Meiothermus taiwanensis TaxID=172827 RepID=UPI000403F5C5
MTYRWFLLLLAALFLAACGGGGAPSINTIEVTPATASKPVGQTQQFNAVAKDANGNVISGVTFTWESSNTSVATVNSSGLATAVAVGTATIKAKAGGKEGSATLNVTAIPTYTVGGEVRYLNGSGLVLALGSQTKTITSNGSFTFNTPVQNGTYSVSVQTQPTSPAQTCTVTPSSVIVNGANVTDLVVECSPYTKWLASSATDIGNAITTDAQGNVIVAGLSKEVLGDEVGTLALAFPDVVVAKYAPNGSRLWVKQFTVGDPNTSPNAESQAKGVATDAAGNIYVVGSAYVSSSNAFKGFILKLGPNGARLDSIKLDESTLNVENGLTSVAVVGSDVYVGGYTAGTAPGGTNAGGEDAVLYKYNTSLALQWARQLGSTGDDQITSVAVDASGAVYAAGFARGILSGGTYQGGTDAFVVKYDGSGTQQWLQQFGTPSDDGASAVVVQGSAVYVAGYVAGGYEPGFTYNGGTDLFVTKFDSSGAEIWRRQYSPDDTPTNIKISPYGMVADASGNVYLVGEVNQAVDTGATYQGLKDVFILQYLANGDRGWARQEGSAQDEIALAVTLHGSDLYLTGWSKGALDGYTNQGLEDIFVLKYHTDGSKK